MSFWSQDEKSLLTRLVEEGGLRFSQIAKIVGRPVNGCIGQANRLGLRKERLVAEGRKVPTNPFRFLTGRPSSVASIALSDISPASSPNGTHLLYLTSGRCRWLVGEGFTCCAKPTGSRSRSYCEDHAKIVYYRKDA